MNRNAHGMWLEGERPETAADPDGANAALIQLPEGTPDWDNSTTFLQRIHEALVANGWGCPQRD